MTVVINLFYCLCEGFMPSMMVPGGVPPPMMRMHPPPMHGMMPPMGGGLLPPPPRLGMPPGPTASLVSI